MAAFLLKFLIFHLHKLVLGIRRMEKKFPLTFLNRPFFDCPIGAKDTPKSPSCGAAKFSSCNVFCHAANLRRLPRFRARG